ncbi:hypothetical protein PYW08_008455 [Mythimna loreyi]|uniref:Uncharacterized protein n=1 Tax=Mythimna loreyi TaxID=667449 RepID=A0ACC2QFF7_9NEOP|nr:hypothetical protein PYW08_008455 [Mythimna loreyi]
MSFKNKVVVVTGSGSGIGAAAAVLFAEEGAHVVIVDYSETRANTTAGKCEQYGNKVLVIIADVSKQEDDEKIIKQTIETFGKLDVLVNNAGTVSQAKILDGTVLNTYDKIMNINLRSVVVLTSLAAPHLVKTKGCIVNTSSVASTDVKAGSPFQSYSISKAGVDCFTRLSAFELASSGVRVNAVNPGPALTNILEHAGISGNWEGSAHSTALKKAAEPKEVANLILYLASDKANSITGACYKIDNGMALM